MDRWNGKDSDSRVFLCVLRSLLTSESLQLQHLDVRDNLCDYDKVHRRLISWIFSVTSVSWRHVRYLLRCSKCIVWRLFMELARWFYIPSYKGIAPRCVEDAIDRYAKQCNSFPVLTLIYDFYSLRMFETGFVQCEEIIRDYNGFANFVSATTALSSKMIQLNRTTIWKDFS